MLPYSFSTSDLNRVNAVLVNYERGDIIEMLATASERVSLSRIRREQTLPFGARRKAVLAVKQQAGPGRLVSSRAPAGRPFGNGRDRLENPALRRSQGCRFAFLPAAGPARRSPGLQQAGLRDRHVCLRELLTNDFPCENKGIPPSAVATVCVLRTGA